VRLESLLQAQQAKINSLQSRISALDRESTDAARTAEVRAIVREMLSDSDFRESLYPDIQQVGYDKGFYIKSADETFLLNISGYIKFRYTGQNRQTDNPRLQGRQPQDDINAFEMEDIRLTFAGYIHSPRLTYRIEVTGDTDNAHDWRTTYAYATYEVAEELKVTAGVFKVAFGRQELVSKPYLQLIDRSLANETFTLNRSIGVLFHGTLAKRLSYLMSITNGFNDRDDSPSREQLDTNFAYAARLVAHILGKPIVTESDLNYSKDPQLETGLSFAYNDDNGDNRPSAFYSIPDRIRQGRGIGGNAMADLTGTDLLQFGADAAFRYRGFSLTAEYYLRSVDGDSEFSQWELRTGRHDSIHQQGGYVQAGYFIVPKKVEVAARIGGVWDNQDDNSWEYAFGVNYFPWSSYNVLLQTDFTRIDDVSADSNRANWSQNDEISMVRVQLQVKF
jgi:phosphate-selective porin OprO/OprP